MRAFLLPLLFIAVFSARAEITTGFAERDISPEIGMERPGGYVKGYHKAFHDPCKARAAVFSDGTASVALVGLDALFIRKPQVDEARRRVAEATDIPPHAVMIGASHSHSSGPTGMVLPGEYDHAEQWIQELAYEGSSMADPVYLETMVNGIVEAVVEAWEKRDVTPLGFDRGEEASVSFNRRFKMKNGLTYTHPRYGNPEMLEPAGPIDPEVGVIGSWNAEGILIGCVVNFACHGTASAPGISANWPWATEKIIRGVFGEDVIVVVLNGNSGDVTQVDNNLPFRRIGGEEDALKVGGRIGAEAVKVLLGLQSDRRSSDYTVGSKAEVLKIERRAPGSEKLAKARESAQTTPDDPKRLPGWVWDKETVLLGALLESKPIQDVEVQAIKVGPAVFISNPAEFFVDFGLRQKEESQFTFTWPVSLANGCVGYVPTAAALAEGGGGYETRLTSYSNLIPTAGDLICDTGIELANTMKPDPLPERKAAAAFTAPWTYGNVPPELE